MGLDHLMAQFSVYAAEKSMNGCEGEIYGLDLRGATNRESGHDEMEKRSLSIFQRFELIEASMRDIMWRLMN